MSDHRKELDNLLSSPRKTLLMMSLPLFFALLVENLQTFVDSVWCSGLGSAELSAISLSHPVYGMIASMGTGLGVGASAAIAKYIGAGDKASADKVVSTTVVMMLVVSLSMSVLMWSLTEPIIGFCGGSDDMDLCLQYIRPFLILSFFLTMNAVWAGMLRAEGAVKLSMGLSILASVLNMVLDPILIYAAGMGVEGAAYATCLSYLSVSVIGFWWYLSGRSYITMSFGKGTFERGTLKEVCIVGVPCALEMFVAPLLCVPQNALVYACGGTAGFVVYSYAFRFIELTLIPVTAISKALVPIISADIGQGDMDKIRESCRLTYRITLTMELVFMVFILLFADILVKAFMNSDSMYEVYDEMVYAVRVFSLTCVFHTFRRVGTSILQATRHAVTASVLTLAREILFLAAFYVAGMFSMKAIYWGCDVTNFTMMFVITIFTTHALKDLSRKLESRKTVTGPS
ncbi:MAG: MATE family efflux transporter [archaeon]|nr:MATE family efflux transporter [archaeon]